MLWNPIRIPAPSAVDGCCEMGSGSTNDSAMEAEVSSNEKKLDADLNRIKAREVAEKRRAQVTRADWQYL